MRCFTARFQTQAGVSQTAFYQQQTPAQTKLWGKEAMNDIILLNNDDSYFAYKAISASQIKKYDHGAYKFWKDSVFNPRKKQTSESDALVFGKLTHCLLFEPDEYNNRYTVVDFGKSRKNKEYEKCKSLYPDKIIVSPFEKEKADKLIGQIYNHELAKLILTGGKCEVPFVWTDPATGLKCKMKVDKIKEVANGRLLVVDYKTSSDIDSVLKWPQKLGYPLQDSFYRRGIKEKFGITNDSEIDFVFILQSNVEGEEDVICIADTDYDSLMAANDIVDHHMHEIAEKLDAWEKTNDPSIWAAYPTKMTLRYSNWYLERGE